MFVTAGEGLRDAVNIAFLLLGAFLALYVATKYGFIHCSMFPHWCEVYRGINTLLYGRYYPSVLVLYGEEGMGDPRYTANYIRKVCGYRVVEKEIGTVYRGNLDGFDAVIVVRARVLGAEELEMLWDFVAAGGKLVMIGDAGVEAPSDDEYLTWKDLGEENREGIVNPWDRKKKDGSIIAFGTNVLGLEYVGTSGNRGEFSGTLKVNDDILTEGLPASLPLYTSFAAVKVKGTSVFGPQVVAAVITDTQAVGGAKPPFPGVVRIGYRVVYIAYPPEEAGEGHVLLYYNLCRVVT